MTTQLSQRIMSNPEYQSLVQERSAFGWWLTLLLCIVYYGFIMLIAFNKAFLATPLGEGMTTSLGIPVGFGVILFSVITTGIYVYRANTKYDAIIRKILEKEVKA
ncbi:MAG: DUF485 domain-containing protein [Zoogloeaceae bacterium]|jgi:uncharacterized membrane protein (DUF485 family)|nr:DUF485 domain-containing protein [Zoogloeaceae bacterium]